ncbi:hypothetical protein D3C72_1131270 [compost metagenome]
MGRQHLPPWRLAAGDGQEGLPPGRRRQGAGGLARRWRVRARHRRGRQAPRRARGHHDRRERAREHPRDRGLQAQRLRGGQRGQRQGVHAGREVFERAARGAVPESRRHLGQAPVPARREGHLQGRDPRPPGPPGLGRRQPRRRRSGRVCHRAGSHPGHPRLLPRPALEHRLDGLLLRRGLLGRIGQVRPGSARARPLRGHRGLVPEPAHRRVGRGEGDLHPARQPDDVGRHRSGGDSEDPGRRDRLQRGRHQGAPGAIGDPPFPGDGRPCRNFGDRPQLHRPGPARQHAPRDRGAGIAHAGGPGAQPRRGRRPARRLGGRGADHRHGQSPRDRARPDRRRRHGAAHARAGVRRGGAGGLRGRGQARQPRPDHRDHAAGGLAAHRRAGAAAAHHAPAGDPVGGGLLA